MDTEIADAGRFEEWLAQSLRTEYLIETLVLSHNFPFKCDFKCFGSALSQTSTLKTLDLTFASSHGTNRSYVYAAIGNNTSITKLKANLDRSVPSDWRQLSHGLARNKMIKKLEISDEPSFWSDNSSKTAIDTNAAVNFFNFFTSNNVITELKVCCFLSAQEMQSLAEGLKYNKSVTVLSLIRPPVTLGLLTKQDPKLDIGPLGDCLKSNTKLTEIRLDSIDVAPEPSEALQRLFDGLTVNRSVKSLTLCDVFISGSATPFSQFLKTTQSLCKLEILGKLKFAEKESHDALLLALSANASITDLTLTPRGDLKLLHSLISNNKTLRSLSLVGRFSREIQQDIEQALTINDTLTRVNVDNVSEALPQFYSNIMKQNTTLKALSIKAAGGLPTNELIEIINASETLRELKVHSFKPFNKETQLAVMRALENNYVLTKIECTCISNGSEISRRNSELMKQRYEDAALIIHVIARSTLFMQLPREIWQSIFSYIRYPGLKSFERLVKSIFDSYHAEIRYNGLIHSCKFTANE